MGEAALSARSSHYRPRSPHTSQYYQCIEDNLETFEHVYDERFSRQYGFFRPFVKGVIYRYLDCGDLHSGFARIRCPDCGHEQLLAFSCKRRHFCPSCHQKRVVEFGEWLCMEVVKKVPHRHVVFSIPKILRRYFLYDRSLLSDLSRCAWETLKTFYQCAASKETAGEPAEAPLDLKQIPKYNSEEGHTIGNITEEAFMKKFERGLIYSFTLLTFLLAFVCFAFAGRGHGPAFCLLGCLSFGTALDFLSSVLTMHMANRRGFLEAYARMNFSLLCFGIIFTPMAAVFVVGRYIPSGINGWLADHYLFLLIFSLLFGALFLFARYRPASDNPESAFTLDRKHRYTKQIFIARRVLLALSLVLSLLVIIEGVKTPMALWSVFYFLCFAATVPLHILHKHLESMAAEWITLVILFYGTFVAFPK